MPTEETLGTDVTDENAAASPAINAELKTRLDEIEAQRSLLGDTETDRLKKEAIDAAYGAPSFDIGEFEDLLSRLEGSKMRQQRQRSVEGRRDIMSQGLAGMMSNF